MGQYVRIYPQTSSGCSVLRVQELGGDAGWVTKATSTWSPKHLAHAVSFTPTRQDSVLRLLVVRGAGGAGVCKGGRA